MIPVNSLRRQIIFVLFFMLGNWAFAFANDAKSPYVLLLDVSGSMEREGAVRYSRVFFRSD